MKIADSKIREILVAKGVGIFLIIALCLLNGAISATTSLSVRSKSMDNPLIFYMSNIFTFYDYEDASQDAPWIISDQYLYVEFDTDEACWGLKIVTDNRTYLEDNYAETVQPYSDAGDDLVMGTSDDLDYYGGVVLIEDSDADGTVDAITDNPYYRVQLAWQVYPEDERTSITAPAVSDSDGDGFYEEDNVSETWCEISYVSREQGSWAYVGDMSDAGYSDHENDVDWTEDGDTVINYNVAAFGYGTGSRNLAHHPHNYEITGVSGWPPVPTIELVPRTVSDNDDVDEDGDGITWDDGWDLYIYLAGRFWNTHYFDRDGDGEYETPLEFQLPAGSYKSKIYIELFHE